ncbi:glucose dehydrogenase [FAD, quinone]-like [Arctopsyche grandis]|uniref:glucose dehydrogenase [FAD, quinone]-like n=1 Tax=Arctopsyche grandis TaxID=121162 RepID=UPI00406D804E
MFRISDFRGNDVPNCHMQNCPFTKNYMYISSNYRTPLMDAFLDSGKKLGYRTIDYNSDERIGFGYVQANTLNGRRHSTSKAFLFPFKDRKNLHILTQATVTKININHVNKKAESVEFVYNKMTYTVETKKEIILSAGCIASPQLLMLSGVGPKEHLSEMNIPVVQDLRVGQNVYDHVAFLGLVFQLNTTGIAITPSNTKIQDVKDWLFNGEGPLSLPSGVEGIAFVKTSVSEEEFDYPDIELLVGPLSLATQRSQNNLSGVKVDYFEEAFGDLTDEETFSIAPMLFHTRSKGQITLKDKNPFHWPQVTYNYFKDRRDLKTMVEGIKYAIKVGTSGNFENIGSRLYKKKLPSCSTLEFGTDQYWECALRSLATPMQHHVGSCRMGPAWDPEAVVDHHLRVHGVKRLRVGDISIIPIPLTAHTNAPAVMVGEKLADILKADWN